MGDNFVCAFSEKERHQFREVKIDRQEGEA